MIRARSSWMRASAAPVLAAQAVDPAFPVWVLAREDGGIVGLYEVVREFARTQGPTPESRGEPGTAAWLGTACGRCAAVPALGVARIGR
jgi:hypothetical protein